MQRVNKSSQAPVQQDAALRAEGFRVVHGGGGSVKRQFTVADDERARFVVVIGEDEMQSGRLSLKTMTRGEPQQLDMEQLIKVIHWASYTAVPHNI